MLLEKRNIEYVEYRVDLDEKVFKEMLNLSNGRQSVLKFLSTINTLAALMI